MGFNVSKCKEFGSDNPEYLMSKESVEEVLKSYKSGWGGLIIQKFIIMFILFFQKDGIVIFLFPLSMTPLIEAL